MRVENTGMWVGYRENTATHETHPHPTLPLKGRAKEDLDRYNISDA